MIPEIIKLENQYILELKCADLYVFMQLKLKKP